MRNVNQENVKYLMVTNVWVCIWQLYQERFFYIMVKMTEDGIFSDQSDSWWTEMILIFQRK